MYSASGVTLVYPFVLKLGNNLVINTSFPLISPVKSYRIRSLAGRVPNAYEMLYRMNTGKCTGSALGRNRGFVYDKANRRLTMADGEHYCEVELTLLQAQLIEGIVWRYQLDQMTNASQA